MTKEVRKVIGVCTTVKMTSNGYGSWQTQLLVSVAEIDAEETVRRLGIPPLAYSVESQRACFRVSTLADRQGDDEGAVQKLSLLLDVSEQSIDWHVVWNASHY